MHADSAQLPWRRPALSEPAAPSAAPQAGLVENHPCRRDSQVLAVVWEAEDAAEPQPAASTAALRLGNPNTGRAAVDYDPFETDDEDPWEQLNDEDFLAEPVAEFDEEESSSEESSSEDLEELLEAESAGPTLERQPPLQERDIDEGLLEEDPWAELGTSEAGDDEDWLREAIPDPEDALRMQPDRQPEFDSGPGSERWEPSVDDSEALRVRQQEGAAAEKNCEEEFSKIRQKRIRNIDLDIRLTGNAGEDFPFECRLGGKPYQPRQWPLLTHHWKASALYHKPLYFEQVRLERYGHSWGPCLQPLMSGVHFFGSLPVLPYKMGVRTPRECVYALGYYRPGNCAPYMLDPVPLSLRGALFQAGAVVGISAVVP